MRRTTSAATAAAVLALSVSLTACDDLGAALDPEPTPTSPGTTPITVAPPPLPRNGRALLTLDGDVRDTLVFGVLTEPVTYAGDDGPLHLLWRTGDYDLFSLRGEIALGAQPTSRRLELQLALDLGPGTVLFTSDDGTCTVSVARLRRRNIEGDVACTGLTDTEGDRTIDVYGPFEAGGIDV